MKVCAIVATRAKPKARKLFALPLVPQVESMRKLALVALLAQTALVVFADEVADAAAFRGRHVVAVRAGEAARAVAGFVVGAYGTGDL